MREKTFSKLMKITALFNIFIIFYPVSVILRFILFSTTGNISGFIFPLLSMFAGLFLTTLICKKEYYFTTSLISYSLIIIPALISGLTYNLLGISRAIFEILAVCFIYIVGVINYPKEYKNVFNSKTLLYGSILLTISLFISNFIDALKPTKLSVLVFIAIFILVSMLLKSFENIDLVFLYRGVEIPEVQKSIRKQNLKFILIFFVAIMVLMNLKKLLILIFNFILLIYNKGILYLLGLLSSNSKIVEDIPKEEIGGNRERIILEIGNTNKFIDYLFIAAFVICSVFILYKIVPKIIKTFINFIKYLKEKFSKVIKLQEKNFNDEECVEIIEITKQSIENKNNKMKKTNLYTLLKKATNPTEKIRLMYGIILKEINDIKIKIEPSDTPGEVARKVLENASVNNDIINITSIYEKVRYGEENPEEASVKVMDEAYTRILKTIKK